MVLSVQAGRRRPPCHSLTGNGTICDPHLGAIQHVVAILLVCKGTALTFGVLPIRQVANGLWWAVPSPGTHPAPRPLAQQALRACSQHTHRPAAMLRPSQQPPGPLSKIGAPARQRMLTTSEPALGSLMARAPTCSPAGRTRRSAGQRWRGGQLLEHMHWSLVSRTKVCRCCPYLRGHASAPDWSDEAPDKQEHAGAPVATG